MNGIFEALWAHINGPDNGPAVIDDEGSLDWLPLLHQVDSVCLGLVYQGLRTGHGVALLLKRDRNLVVACLAVLRGRGIVVPLDPILGSKALSAAVGRSRPDILVYDEAFRSLAEDLQKTGKFRQVVCIGKNPGTNDIPWSKLLATDTTGASYPESNLNHIACHRHSISSDHSLRTVIATVRTLTLNAQSTIRHFGFTEDDRHLNPGFPLCETVTQVLVPLLSAGSLVMTTSLNPKSISHMTARFAVNRMMLPAYLCRTLCQYVVTLGKDMSGVKLLVATGHTPEWTRGLAEKSGAQRFAVVQEIPSASGPFLAPLEVDGTERQGQPCPGYILQVTTPDGRPAPGDMVGELWIKGNLVSSTLLEDFGKLEVPRTDGWLRSGLAARYTMAGEVNLLGDLAEIVNRKGQNIIPRETVDCLEQHPGVIEATIVTVTKAKGKPMLIALVHRGGDSPPSADELTQHLKYRLTPAQLPDQVLLAPTLPHLPDGTVDCKRLANHLQSVISRNSG